MRQAVRRSLPALLLSVAALAVCAPAGASSIFSNGIYQARVSSRDTDLASFGSWSAATDSGHPVGADKDLLFAQNPGAGITVGTSFSSLRVYDGGGVTDYAFSRFHGGIDLDPYVSAEGASPFGEAGFRTAWDFAPEGLSIVQDVVIVGTTFADSAIYHTVEITNAGAAARDIGWRNLYDWQVDDPVQEDGPGNSVETTSATVVDPTMLEFSHTPSDGEFVRVRAGGAATYEVLLAIGFDPGFIPSLPVSVPDEYAYAKFPDATLTSFDYAVNPALSAAGDSAGLSWFGRTAETAITLERGGSTRITQVLFGAPPGAAPPGAAAPEMPVPEPGTLLLLAGGLGLLAALRRPRPRA